MKVRILLSTYNGEQFLREQIESIRRQTYTDWQLVIRDDGSSDQTAEIIEEYCQKDQRIEWLNRENPHNVGVIESFYQLVKSQTADFYFFSDQDDVWLPDKLERQLAAATAHDTDRPLLVYTDLTVVNQDLKVMSPSMIRSQSGHANQTLLAELTENTVTGGVTMINHALAQLWTTTDDVIMHDWYLALLAASFGDLVYLDQPTELYRQHDHNVLGARTWSKRLKKWLRPQTLFSLYWDLIGRSQRQAQQLLHLPLDPEKRELVEAYVTLLEKGFLERIRLLKAYGFKKNKAFHTLVFSALIITKIAYKE